MPSIRELLAAKVKQMEAHIAADKAAKQAGVPADMLEDYLALQDMARSGAVPKDIPQAAAALAAAAKIARHRGVKPGVVPGTTDLQWPPTQSFEGPIGYAPYLTRFKQVLGMTFPQAPAAAPAQAPAAQAARQQPANPSDPLAALREMAANAAAQASKRTSDKPLAEQVALAEPEPADDEP